jgi:hypothetical protein
VTNRIRLTIAIALHNPLHPLFPTFYILSSRRPTFLPDGMVIYPVTLNLRCGLAVESKALLTSLPSPPLYSSVALAVLPRPHRTFQTDGGGAERVIEQVVLHARLLEKPYDLPDAFAGGSLAHPPMLFTPCPTN